MYFCYVVTDCHSTNQLILSLLPLSCSCSIQDSFQTTLLLYAACSRLFCILIFLVLSGHKVTCSLIYPTLQPGLAPVSIHKLVECRLSLCDAFSSVLRENVKMASMLLVLSHFSSSTHSTFAIHFYSAFLLDRAPA